MRRGTLCECVSERESERESLRERERKKSNKKKKGEINFDAEISAHECIINNPLKLFSQKLIKLPLYEDSQEAKQFTRVSGRLRRS